MGSINKQISRFETTAVYTHPDAKVDIVLVHGLNGDPEKTWTAKNGVFWPADLLPESLRNVRANILVYGYNADVYSKKHGVNPSDNFIYMHAQTLVTTLTHYRKDEMSSRNPIIWVCHSLGGILVKRAVLYSNDLRATQHEDYRQIYVSTFGIIFLGTPHTGSDLTGWATMLQAMSDAVVPKAFWQSESVLLKTLKKDNETLQNINNHFLDIYQRFQILMAHENHRTDLKGTKMMIVDSQSASPQLPGVAYYAIEATHSGMCKFDSKNAPGYRTIAGAIRDWVGDAPDVISTRWRVEEDEKLARAKHEIEERMKPWLKSTQEAQQANQGQLQDPNNHINSPTRIVNSSRPALPEPETPDQPESSSQETTSSNAVSRDPIFVRPTIFKPNTHFKGRDKEMKDLHKKLMDRQRRLKGTSSVLIQSMPGGGKTHLARQYVFEHKYDYPGGIFWIRSKSVQELEYGYWDIAKTVGLKEVEHLQKDGLRDTKKMVKAVQGWMSRTEGWLLVLDGLHFDYPDLQNFIPFHKNTSIIYTSTQRTAGEDYQFDNPQVLALEPLSTRYAQELLLEEMGKKKPWTQDDLSRALELVQLMDRLPLMIHVAALQLKATREPLSKYLRSYRSRPKAGNLDAYRTVREQLQYRGNIAALNLMSLLAFFSQYIPVEMLAYGLKALDKRTPVKTYDAETRKASLNNTFKVLIAFALIERNENIDTPSDSDRSSRSVDMDQDNLDILRIHGIVQAFFVDTLADEKQAPFWLERAVCVFCRAFDESDRHIREHPMTGLPEDYRRFLIHGKKLASFLDRFERRVPDLAESRELLESHLDSIQERIDRLNRPTRSTDSADAPIVSVFERSNSNSLSEIESESPPSHDSILEWQTGDDEPVLETPAPLSPTDHNPYHWHVTYPYGVSNPDEDASRTITPQPPPTEVFDSITYPDDYEVRRDPSIHHRTIRRNSERRYRDHAGSWRASRQILSDPRVSLSRETARGFVHSSDMQTQQGGGSGSSTSNRLTAGSDAELTLNRITKVSPPLQREGAYVSEKSRTLSNSSASSSMRPKLIAGGPSYTSTAQAETAIDDDPTPTFSRVIGTYQAPSSSYAAETIMRLKEEKPISTDGLAPVKVSSPLAAEPLTTSNLPSRASPAGANRSPSADTKTSGYISKPPSISPSRSARSSPGQYNGPFQPPPIPVEVNTTSSLHSGPGVRHWDTYGRSDQDDDEDHDHMTQSLPSIKPHSPDPPYPYDGPARPERPVLNVHPPPWTASSTRLEKHPQGYSSQPMSRDPSHQSTHSLGSVPSRNGSPRLQQVSPSSSPGPQVMQRPRSRRPSVVETEPSPRLGPTPGLDSPMTSYSLYNESARGRRRTGSGDVYDLGMRRSTQNLDAQPRPGGFFSRFGRRGRSTGGVTLASNRPQSTGRRLRKASGQIPSPRGSPDLSGAGGAFASPGGVDMSRSGSGGIKLADGSVVQFGQNTGSENGRASSGHGRAGSGGKGGGVGLGIL